MYPPFLDTAKNHVDELPVSRTIRNKPAGQHGDTDPTGASSSAGGVGEEKKKGAEAETLGAQGCWLCREHLLSTYYVWGVGGNKGRRKGDPQMLRTVFLPWKRLANYDSRSGFCISCGC